ncbi:hypothetical protein F383_13255 [Gossypium arboreum]|uniref:Uncharacterized protein n=1 Tax=Gossypium arboreum TaxID=29729 RepID=A0A0B0NEV2_GOSAR|nr:hypothetical protein F383_13255 [Gossypium arboreum]
MIAFSKEFSLLAICCCLISSQRHLNLGSLTIALPEQLHCDSALLSPDGDETLL